MDKNFIQIFAAITEAAEVVAEQAVELNHKDNNEKGEADAAAMKADFAALTDKIKAADFDGKLSRNEYAQLTVAAYITTNQIKNRINTLRKATEAYDNIIIPKLTKIIEEAKTDDEAQKLADEILIFEGNK